MAHRSRRKEEQELTSELEVAACELSAVLPAQYRPRPCPPWRRAPRTYTTHSPVPRTASSIRAREGSEGAGGLRPSDVVTPIHGPSLPCESVVVATVHERCGQDSTFTFCLDENRGEPQVHEPSVPRDRGVEGRFGRPPRPSSVLCQP